MPRVFRSLSTTISILHTREKPRKSGTSQRPLNSSKGRCTIFKWLDTTSFRLAFLKQYLRVGGHLPPNPVILSFDDGWEDQFTYAFPVLRKYGFTATFFIVTNYVGRRDFLSWNQIRNLASAGMTIGSHSCTHPFLSRIVDHSVLESEISGCKRTIELHLGKPIEEFAYPYGAFNQSVIQLVEKAGYRSARADYFGMWHSKNDQYFLSAINAPPNLDAFKRACVGTSRSTSLRD